jgi:hypothetical protein
MRPVSAPRHCATDPRTANALSSRRGPATPSNAFSVTMQGHAVTSGRRERSFPSLSTLCGHPRHCRATPSTVTTSQCCWSARGQDVATTTTVPRTGPVDDTLESVRGGGRTTNHYAATLEAAPVRVQGAPRRIDWSGILQDGLQLHGTARHAPTRRKIVWHACKLLLSWPIKGGAVPQPQKRRDDGRQSPTRSPPSPRYWHPPQSIPLGPGGQASSPTTLVAPFTSTTVQSNTVPRAHRCWTYGPGRNQDKPSVISC